ncbi:hypothetical protein JAAARDRAFT_295392 [Jaapia argillacea MUCL 33604]|uniref:Uncharacterized protein n=1 Tax=Jaapia argillacea MUCL 33604 TaxID=933084 RepID=A0A067PP41_9AGAM|nr:hypothetical protein JAAARDRAFT_295392 [Jaapia argillacea MUCL 33604]
MGALDFDPIPSVIACKFFICRHILEDSIQDLARQFGRFLGEEEYPTNYSKLDNLRQVPNTRHWEPPEPSTPSYVNPGTRSYHRKGRAPVEDALSVPVRNMPSIIRKSASLAVKTGEFISFRRSDDTQAGDRYPHSTQLHVWARYQQVLAYLAFSPSAIFSAQRLSDQGLLRPLYCSAMNSLSLRIHPPRYFLPPSETLDCQEHVELLVLKRVRSCLCLAASGIQVRCRSNWCCSFPTLISVIAQHPHLPTIGV